VLADQPAYEHMLAEPVAALVVALAPSYEAIVAPATTTGKNIMPRVAALLDVMQVSDIVKVIAPDTFERLIYAGNAVQTVRSRDKVKVITVRTSTFQATGTGTQAAPIEEIAGAPDPGISSFVGEDLSKSERPSSRRPRSSSREAAPCRAEKTLPNTSSRSRTSWARQLAPHARRSMRVCPQRLAGRSDRQGCGTELYIAVGISGRSSILPA
jgi:electron transfer flavoprotein alpha subunit